MNRHRHIIRGAAWGGSVLAVLTVGVVFIPREYPAVGFWEALYRSIHLFFFDSLEPFPESWPLVLIIFVAPLIAMAAAGTLVTYLFRLTPQVRVRFWHDHVVVCGVGRMGKLICAELRSHRMRVIGIDRGPAEAFDDWVEETRVPVLYGDFHAHGLLARAGANRARCLIFASGNDLANLEAAMGAYAWMRADSGPNRVLWVHVANEQLAAVAAEAIKTSGRVGIRFFDGYSLAAGYMVRRHFSRAQRETISEVTIAGFGKFGRDLFEKIVRDLGPDENIAFRIIDRADRGAVVKDLAVELGVLDRVTCECRDIRDIETADATGHAFFLCTDDDLGNLTAAITLAHRLRCAHIYVRMAQWPMTGVADQLGEQCDITFINLNKLMMDGVRTLPGIFHPAEISNPKISG